MSLLEIVSKSLVSRPQTHVAFEQFMKHCCRRHGNDKADPGPRLSEVFQRRPEHTAARHRMEIPAWKARGILKQKKMRRPP